MTRERGTALTALVSGRLVLAVGMLVYAGVLVWIGLTGPDPLPAHLGADGAPTRWESKAWVIGVQAVIGVMLLAVVLGCRALISRSSPELLSLPSARGKAYWTSPERRSELNRRLNSDLELIFGLTFMLMAWVAVGLVRAAEGAGDPGLTAAILVYGVLVVGATMVLFRGPKYRAPKGWTND